MIGVASVAVALPPIVARASPAAASTALQLRDKPRFAYDREPLVASFADLAWNPVGPSFEIPPDWWEIANGVARLRNAIVCASWPGPACSISGLVLFRGKNWVLRELIDFGHEGPECIALGSTLQVDVIEIKFDGFPRRAAEQALRGVLL